MANTVQQEYQIYNQKGEVVAANILVPGDGNQAQNAQYIAGVPYEHVDPVKNASHQPTKKSKP